MPRRSLPEDSIDKYWSPDLVHANDRHCGLIPSGPTHVFLLSSRSITLHTKESSTVVRSPTLGIPEASFHIDEVEFYNRFSFIKAGLVYASHLTTVSQTYAREITTAEFGCGLEGSPQATR
jgi:starch synthase